MTAVPQHQGLAAGRPGTPHHKTQRDDGRTGVNTLGGMCQLAGLGLVVRDLVQVVEYRGHLRRLKRRQQEIRGAIVARGRRFLSRPISDDPRFQVAASVSRSAGRTGGSSMFSGGSRGYWPACSPWPMSPGGSAGRSLWQSATVAVTDCAEGFRMARSVDFFVSSTSADTAWAEESPGLLVTPAITRRSPDLHALHRETTLGQASGPKALRASNTSFAVLASHSRS